MMAVDDAYVFAGFLLPLLTLLFFPKPPTTFLTCFCRGERRKYAGKKSLLNRGSNSQRGHESDTTITEPSRRSDKLLDQTKLKAFADDKLNVTKLIISVFDRVEHIEGKGEIACTSNFSFSYNVFKRLLSQTRQ